MIRPIVTDVFSLNRKAQPATKADLPVAQDLLDTLKAHADHCVGMAANMIGVNKRIIVVDLGPFSMAMLNPVIVHRSPETYEAQEGCLSLPGQRTATRHQSIEVEYQDLEMKRHRQNFSGFTAQIIQHEIDHCEGVLI